MIITNYDHHLKECGSVKELMDTYRAARQRLYGVQIVELRGELKSRQLDDVPPPLADPDIALIQEVVAKYFHYSLKGLLGLDRHKRVVVPRYIAMYLCYLLTGASTTEIGRAFKRHHSSVIHALEQIDIACERDPRMARKIARLTERVFKAQRQTKGA